MTKCLISPVCCVDRWPRPTITNLDMVRIKYANEILDVEEKDSIYNLLKRSFVVRTHM